ncbi:hypothetical protein [Haloactinospora alba]|uniref:hypothetical protein n=1 Tax=Haloactinospora alba TaxID=405555 RepID=UPI001150C98B|nr:hypothetical protein [Haloactinospora alba]
MIDEFRSAFQELIDSSVTAGTGFSTAVHRVYQLAPHVPAQERALAMEALGPVLAGDHGTPGVIADLMVVAGAMAEIGTPPGATGVEVLRQLVFSGRGAVRFLEAWDRTGGGALPDPDSVGEADQDRVTPHLGDDAPVMTVAWWTIRRGGLAAKTMLTDPDVRAALRRDTALHSELTSIAQQLRSSLWEFDEISTLLRMVHANSLVVLDSSSGRGFRVRFDGISDNQQLHTLLADELVGADSYGLDGQRPDPRCSAAFRDADPHDEYVYGWWNLLVADGTDVTTGHAPADIPHAGDERLVTLQRRSQPRPWKAQRRHPQVQGWLVVERELSEEERAAWWELSPVEPAPAEDRGERGPETPEAFTNAAQVSRFVEDILNTGTREDAAAPPSEAPRAAEEGTARSSELTEAFPAVDDGAEAPSGDPPGETTRHDAPGEGSDVSGPRFLPPLPPGVSDSSAWGPRWL